MVVWGGVGWWMGCWVGCVCFGCAGLGGFWGGVVVFGVRFFGGLWDVGESAWCIHACSKWQTSEGAPPCAPTPQHRSYSTPF